MATSSASSAAPAAEEAPVHLSATSADGRIYVLLSSSPLDPAAATAAVTHPRAGAVATFLGTTRNHHGGRAVSRLEYEAYGPMAVKVMVAIAQEAAEAAAPPPARPSSTGAAGTASSSASAPAPHAAASTTSSSSSSAAASSSPEDRGLTRVYVAHRVGHVPVAECSVVVAVSSPHRAEALAACGHIIDEVKARVPVWKREWYVDGGRQWKENCECAWRRTAPPPPPLPALPAAGAAASASAADMAAAGGSPACCSCSGSVHSHGADHDDGSSPAPTAAGTAVAPVASVAPHAAGAHS